MPEPHKGFLKNKLFYTQTISNQLERCLLAGSDPEKYHQCVKDLVSLVEPYKDKSTLFTDLDTELASTVKEIQDKYPDIEDNIDRQREMQKKISQAVHQHSKKVFGVVITLLDKKGTLLKSDEFEEIGFPEGEGTEEPQEEE